MFEVFFFLEKSENSLEFKGFFVFLSAVDIYILHQDTRWCTKGEAAKVKENIFSMQWDSEMLNRETNPGRALLAVNNLKIQSQYWVLLYDFALEWWP